MTTDRSTTAPFTVRPISETGAAEVLGLDCAVGLAPAVRSALEEAFLRYPILVFRDQSLTPAQQASFSRQFGPLAPQERTNYVHPDDPDVLILSNAVGGDGKPIGVVDAGDYLHSDSSHEEDPVKSTILYSVRNPSTGGDTEYVNMYLVYERLPDDLRATLEGRTAVHHVSKSRNPRVFISPDRPDAKAFYAAAEQLYPDVHQPVIRTHPETGRQAVYVTPRFTLSIDGMDADLSEQLLKRVFAIMRQPEVGYRHRWRDNDLVMWDNRCLAHRATGGYGLPDVRRMHRTTVRGDRPFFRRSA